MHDIYDFPLALAPGRARGRRQDLRLTGFHFFVNELEQIFMVFITICLRVSLAHHSFHQPFGTREKLR